MPNYYLELSMLPVLFILFAFVYFQHLNTPSHVRFLEMIFIICAQSILEILYLAAIQHPISALTGSLLKTAFILSCELGGFSVFHYTCAYVQQKLSPFLKVFYVLLGIQLLATLLAGCTGKLFQPEADNLYSSSSMDSFLSAFCSLYILAAGVIPLVYRKYFTKKITASIHGFCFAVLLGGCLQSQLMSSRIYVSYYFTGLAGIFLFLALETPDYIALQKSIKELEAARNEAEEANHAKSDFLARMSHEIRTPINSMLGMDEMILRGGSPEEIQEYAFHIKSAGGSLLFLINDILDFSKIESGKMELVLTDYELLPMLDDLLLLISSRADAKNLTVEEEIDPKLPTALHGDVFRLKQVITNLLTNAVKYTQKGTVTLKAELVELGDQEATIRFSVKDTGMGIKPEDKDKLFDSFRRVDQNKNQSIEGTGLGLAITKQLLKLMDTEPQVESIYGVGSIFSFELRQPLVNATPIGDFATKRKGLSDKKSQIYHESFQAPKASALVVDDTAMNRMIIKGLLNKSKMQIEEAANGTEALEKMQQKRYDIIFMDHMMPGMDGIEVMQRAKQMEANLCTDSYYVALTANAVAGAREMYLEQGFDAFLAKPVNGSDLEKVILEGLKGNYTLI